MKEKLKKLNWLGFTVIMVISFAGAIANKNVTNIYEWLVLVLFIGFPVALFFLWMGRKC